MATASRRVLYAALGAAFAFVGPAGPGRAQNKSSELVALFEQLCIRPPTNEDMLNAAGRIAAERAWPLKMVGPARAGLHGFIPGHMTAWTMMPPPQEILFTVFLVDPDVLPDLKIMSCGFFMADNSPRADDLVPEVDRILKPRMLRSKARSFSAETKFNWYESPDGRQLTNCGRKVAVIDNLSSKRSSSLMLSEMHFPSEPPWDRAAAFGRRCPAQPD